MLHPSSIKVELLHTYGRECTHDTVVASVVIKVVKSPSPFRSNTLRETLEIKEYAAKEVWHILYGGLDKEIRDIADFIFHNCPEVDYAQFHRLIGNLKRKLSFNQPPIPEHNYTHLVQNLCQAENHQQQTPATFSETPTDAARETKAGLPTLAPTCKISQSQWDKVCGALSGKSTGHGSPQESAPTSSSSTKLSDDGK
jgi:hypothetical protein